jgi:osmotically-inducible protein OsmY
MKNSVWLVPFVIGLNVFLAGCDERGQQPANQTTPSSPTAPAAAKMSNSDLETAVRAKLKSDPKLKDARLDVDANAAKNEITLSGTVPLQEMRIKAIELAKSAHSGLNVNDKIDVKPAA